MKPIIFNTEMVRAILDGRKTQTRRSCLNIVEKDYGFLVCSKPNGKGHITPLKEFDMACKMAINHYAPYQIGDVIYVRETFIHGVKYDENDRPLTTEDGSDWIWKTYYRADGEYLNWVNTDGDEINPPWKPSIHMPKECARLFLRVKDVRIERLNDISHEDSIKEGIIKDKEHESWILGWKNYSRNVAENEFMTPCGSFKSLWESIYGNGSFDSRYVWVIEFEQISKEEVING